MARTKNTKRNLLTSLLCILLSVSLLVSSTFAWFTDRVSNKGNIITSGNLDLEMYWTDDPSSGTWYNVEDAAYNTIFSYDNWEPGYTDVKYIKLVNKGNLALNYDLSIEAQGAVGKLAEVINVYYAINEDKLNLRSDLDQLSCIGLLNNVMNGGSQASGTLLPEGTTSLFHNSGEVILTLAMTMVTSAGNEYQNESSGDFTIKALATQAPWESDSFGSDYDSQAEMPITLVATDITVPVTAVNDAVPAGGLEIVGPAAAAYLPEGVKLVPGTTAVTFRVTPLDTSSSGMTVVNDEILIPVDVHIEGVAEDNNVPIVIDLGAVLPKDLNMGNYKLVHVEDNVNNQMTQVSDRDQLANHNEFAYNSATGQVSIAIHSFSGIDLMADTANRWQGGVDYSWFADPAKYEINASGDSAYRRIYTLTNADQLYGFAKLLGGMHIYDPEWTKYGIEFTFDDDKTNKDTVLVDGYGRNIVGWGFNGHTIQLLNDVNLNGGKAVVNGKTKIFYPIGYFNNTAELINNPNAATPIVYDRDDGKELNLTGVSSSVNAFRGTFNGNGHTISNFYQNTWEMFGDYNSGYSGTPNYYKDAMGLFGYLYGATVYNFTIDHFESDGEFTPTGVVAAYAAAAQDPTIQPGLEKPDYGENTIQNITITNCNPRVYNTGNGGIVGIAGLESDPSYTSTNNCKMIFNQITVDQTNTISALWGSWDVACGGIVGMFRGNGSVDLKKCSMSAKIDVFNDVCGNYQYYWYRYSGMMIGCIFNSKVENGYTVPDTSTIHATECTVRFDEWNDYYYCELVDNSLASYTHDHQMSRLEEVQAVNGTSITYLDGTTKSVPTSGRYNYVVVGEGERSTENATCYHFLNGAVWKHEDAGTETVDGVAGVLKEDKQHIYLPFNQLFQGYGWGVKHIAFLEFPGITLLTKEAISTQKFIAKYETSYEKPLKLPVGTIANASDLFAAKEGVELKGISVYMELIRSETDVERLSLQTSGAWTKRQVFYADTNTEAGIYRVIIQDYDYCLPTSIYVQLVAAETKTAPCAHCDGADAQWTPWTVGALPSGHYYLQQNVVADVPMTLASKANVVLDLNGYTMTYPQSAAIEVGEGQQFSVVDSGTTGKIEGLGDDYGLLKVNGGTLNLYDCQIGYVDGSDPNTAGIIWAANLEKETTSVQSTVLFNENVKVEGQVYLTAEAEMIIKGQVNSDNVAKIELESGALLAVQDMTGNSSKRIKITANESFAYAAKNVSGDNQLMETLKSWFEADFQGRIDYSGMYLVAEVDISAAIQAAVTKGDKIKEIQDDAAKLSAVKTGTTCPMCDAQNITWEKYDRSKHALITGGSAIHVYFDNSVNCGTKDAPLTSSNIVGSYKGNSTMCVLVDNVNIYTDGRFLINPNNTLNIMGKGSVHSNGTSGLGMFTILGKNPTVNLYGCTYTYSGNYTKNGEFSNPTYALIFANTKSAEINLFNDVVIGYSKIQLNELEGEEKANYNVNIFGTLNMYGGTIQNGVSQHEWLSGNVTLNESAVLNMYNGLITGGQTAYRGGNVLMRSYSTVKMGYNKQVGDIQMNPAITNGVAKFDMTIYEAALNRLVAKWEKENAAHLEAGEETTPKPSIAAGSVETIPGGGNIGTTNAVGYNTFKMYSGTVSGGKVDCTGTKGTAREGYEMYMGGGNIYLNGGFSNKANLYGGTVSGGNAYAGGNLYIRNGEKLTITNNATVTGGSATYGGNVHVFNKAEMIVNGGNITDGTATYGGNISVGQQAGTSAQVTINDGTISGGVATKRGGNIYITGVSVLNVAGGNIHSGTANESNYGPNIYAVPSASADKTLVTNPSVTISGGTIAGGVLVATWVHPTTGEIYTPVLTLKGAPVIKDDQQTLATIKGLWMAIDAQIADISELSNTAQIYIYKGNTDNVIPFAAASENANAVASCFTSVKNGYVVACEENVLKLVKSAG